MPRGVRRVARVVRHHADGGAGLVQLLEQIHHRLAVLRIQVARGLVGQQNRRLAAHRARHGDALLLAARELAGQVLGAVRHAHALERRRHALLALGRAHAAVGERQLDVLEDVRSPIRLKLWKMKPTSRLRTRARCASDSFATGWSFSV